MNIIIQTVEGVLHRFIRAALSIVEYDAFVPGWTCENLIFCTLKKTGGENDDEAELQTFFRTTTLAESCTRILDPVFRTSAKEHLDFPANNGRLQGKAAFPAPWQPNIVANNAPEDSNQPTR
ncbi:MAG TPA: hypothetical protein PK442_03125 [Synergistales bacterium]|nr:hypothetical protein [Synergistales bacterium]